jgi:hypothetical protein
MLRFAQHDNKRFAHIATQSLLRGRKEVGAHANQEICANEENLKA